MLVESKKLILIHCYSLTSRVYLDFTSFFTNVPFSVLGFSPGHHTACSCHVFLASPGLCQLLSLVFHHLAGVASVFSALEVRFRWPVMHVAAGVGCC